MKKTIVAIALAATTVIPSLAFAYPVTGRSVQVRAYNNAQGGRTGSYLRRAPGTATGNRVIVRQHVRGNSLVRSHVRSTPVSGTAAAN